MFSDNDRENIRVQVIDYLTRTKMAPSALAVVIGIEPQTLTNFLSSIRRPHFTTLKTIEKWLEEYDHVDFRVK